MNLNDMLRSEEYMAWDADRMINDAFDSHDRHGRCITAAKDGADGSFHAEILNDWLNFLEFNSLDMGINEKDYHNIYVEILECWDYHDKEGSLYDEVG